MRKPKIERQYKQETHDGTPYVVEVVSGTAATVQMISHTTNPDLTMALAAQGYTGTYSASLKQNISVMMDDIVNTRLATPLEMVHFTFLINDVTRAWTHQAVRYRIGSAYVQESMRFLGYKDTYQVLVSGPMLRDSVLLDEYGEAVCQAVRTYVHLKDQGVPDQDARGALPTNILTRMFWNMSLSTLRNVFNTRWCCQAQTTEWIPILAQMRQLVRVVAPRVAEKVLTAPIDRDEPCGFNASFDRPCSWRGRAQEDQEQSVLG